MSTTIGKIRKKFMKKIAKELTLVQPIEGKGWVVLMEFFERNPGVGFYFTSKKRQNE